MPWGWVSVTAYMTALICVAFSQFMEPGGAVDFVRDFQTLIAGLATMAALLIAAEQLNRQRTRDTVDAVRYYEAELDAMRDLQTAVSRIWNSAGHPSLISMEKAWWGKLEQQTNVSLGPAIARLSRAVDEHNALVEPPNRPFISLYSPDERQLRDARFSVRGACASLGEEIENRRRTVSRLIEATA